jgi:hypothetical protein
VLYSHRKERKKEEQQVAEVAKEDAGVGNPSVSEQADSAPKKTFDLSDVYSAVHQMTAPLSSNPDFDFTKEIPVEAPPANRLAYLARTVMAGVDLFAKQRYGCALDSRSRARKV